MFDQPFKGAYGPRRAFAVACAALSADFDLQDCLAGRGGVPVFEPVGLIGTNAGVGHEQLRSLAFGRTSSATVS